VLLALFFCVIFLREKGWSDTHYKIFGTPRHLESAMEWVRKTLPGEPLFLSPSDLTRENLSLWTDARSLVPGPLSFGYPASQESRFRNFARMLKTMRVDLDAFLAQRWDDFSAKDALKQQTAYYTRDVSWEITDSATWPIVMLGVPAFDSASLEKAKPMIRRYYKEASPIDPPFYVWLNRNDEKLVKQMPERYGAKLVYENPSVKIYSFTR
jgi:hypothetical protein